MKSRTACEAGGPVFRQRFTRFQQSVDRAKPHVRRRREKRVESKSRWEPSFAGISPLRDGLIVPILRRLLDVLVSHVLRLFKTDNSTGPPGKPAPAPTPGRERRDAVRYSSDEEPLGPKTARGASFSRISPPPKPCDQGLRIRVACKLYAASATSEVCLHDGGVKQLAAGDRTGREN
jgi:hypothetical protein